MNICWFLLGEPIVDKMSIDFLDELGVDGIL